jgi:hypothetical protein
VRSSVSSTARFIVVAYEGRQNQEFLRANRYAHGLHPLANKSASRFCVHRQAPCDGACP